MPATIETKEQFDGNTTTAQLDVEVQLRLKAGAIRATYKKEGAYWILTTQWNVFGEQ